VVCTVRLDAFTPAEKVNTTGASGEMEVAASTGDVLTNLVFPQTFALHRLLWQSAFTEQALFVAQGEHVPPQSTSVSVPPLNPSPQLPDVHVPLPSQ